MVHAMPRMVDTVSGWFDPLTNDRLHRLAIWPGFSAVASAFQWTRSGVAVIGCLICCLVSRLVYARFEPDSPPCGRLVGLIRVSFARHPLPHSRLIRASFTSFAARLRLVRRLV